MPEYKLPKWLSNRRAIIVPKSKDGESFIDACTIAANLFYVLRNAGRITSFIQEKRKDFDFSGGVDFQKFEENNPLFPLNVYITRHEKKEIVGLFYATEKDGAPLNLYWDKKKNYFCAVRRHTALLRRQVSGKKSSFFHCELCGYVSKTENGSEQHKIVCNGGTLIKFPKRDDNGYPPVMKFDNFKALSRCPMWGTVDSECFLKKLEVKEEDEEKNTKLLQEHNASAWGACIKTPSSEFPEYIVCYSEKPTEEFVKKLIQKACSIFEEFWEPRVFTKCKFYKDYNDINIPVEMILDDKKNAFELKYFLKNREMPIETRILGKEKMNFTHTCNLCDEKFKPDDVKVIDHDHFTGEYFGIAHRKCNSLRRSQCELNIYIHNANYDFVELRPMLAKQHFSETKTRIKGFRRKNSTKYTSITLEVEVAKEIHHEERRNKKGEIIKRENKSVPKIFSINFRDSLDFTGKKSLEKIMETFPEDMLKVLKHYFSEKFYLLKRKGMFPYSFLTDRSKFYEGLPEHSECFDILSQKHMKKEDYDRMVSTYKELGCKNMMEYLLTYLKQDCAQLFDVFSKLANDNIKDEVLDPRNFMTLPSLAFHGMLRKTKAKLDLFPEDQKDMFDFFNRTRRGGFTTAPIRYAKANHKYLKNYDPNKPSIIIFPFDFHGMYSAAQKYYLPVGDYQYMTQEELNNWEQFLTIEGWGCSLEVDVDIPLELHDYFNDYPPLPDHLNGRLDAHLWNRRNYGVYYKELKSALDLGYVLKKIHFGIKYREAPFSREFVEYNLKKRAEAPTKADGELYKLRLNSNYGKYGEDKSGRVEEMVAYNDEEYEKLMKLPNFVRSEEIPGVGFNCVMRKKTAFQDRPVAIAHAILGLAKVFNNNAYYNVFKKVFGDRVRFLYGDTDSQKLKFETDDFFMEMKDHAHLCLDTAVYKECDKDTLRKIQKTGFSTELNDNAVGFLADESPDDFIVEFFATAAKEKLEIYESGKVEIKAKGIVKRTRAEYLKRQNFYDAIFNNKINQEVPQHQIRNIKNKNYTIEMTKKIFTGDQKRILLSDNINTLANGHWRDLGYTIIPPNVPLPEKGTPERKLLEGMREKYRKELFGENS